MDISSYLDAEILPSMTASIVTFYQTRTLSSVFVFLQFSDPMDPSPDQISGREGSHCGGSELASQCVV